MTQKTYKWIGASGYNPLVGSVNTGQVVSNTNSQVIEKLLEQGLIAEKAETSKKTISKKDKE